MSQFSELYRRAEKWNERALNRGLQRIQGHYERHSSDEFGGKEKLRWISL
jgi:predicted secreted protein